MRKGLRYEDSGVNIAAGEEAVRRIKEKVRTTFTGSVLTDLGKFGGFFQLDLSAWKKPVLVSSIDGVGTKLKVAIMAGKHDTIGEDLVNHCINDILVGGARPLFFLDYIGTGILQPGIIEEIISGMVRGCRNAQCALIGGEMAEMPGFYQKGDYDVAGAIVGIVEKDRVVDGSRIKAGDKLIGLRSTGLHTNGYSLARKVIFEIAGYGIRDTLEGLDMTAGEALLQVHRSYLPIVESMSGAWAIPGMSHITGGGIEGNTRRILPPGFTLNIAWDAWEVPPLFQLIQKLGRIPDVEMRKTFNLGIGYIFIIPEENAEGFSGDLIDRGEKPVIIGTVKKV